MMDQDVAFVLYTRTSLMHDPGSRLIVEVFVASLLPALLETLSLLMKRHLHIRI